MHHLEKQYQRLQGELAQVGLIAVGTITPRRIVQPHPEDKRTPKTYGPYYQWTYKREGKTVTVNLTKVQAGAFQKAIHNQRKLYRILKKMLELSRTILQRTTGGSPGECGRRAAQILNFVPFGTVHFPNPGGPSAELTK